MKLSLLIPVYNGAPFIIKAYQSIVNQKLDTIDFEIIFIENNSTDETVNILKGLQRKDPTIKICYQPQQGEAYARNMGVEKAQGDYIYQLDVDDEIFPGALQRLMYVLDTYPKVDAVLGKRFKSESNISDCKVPKEETHNIMLKEAPYWGLLWFRSLKNVVGTPAFIYRRKTFKKIGNYVDLKIGTDTGLHVRLGMSCSVAFIDTYIYLYLKHPNSVMEVAKKANGMVFHTWKRFVKDHLVFYLNHEVPSEFKKILFRQLFAMMGKLIVYSDDFTKRQSVKKQMFQEIRPVAVPWFLNVYLTILVYLPFQPLLKFYVYYLTRWYVDRHLNSGFICNKKLN